MQNRFFLRLPNRLKALVAANSPFAERFQRAADLLAETLHEITATEKTPTPNLWQKIAFVVHKYDLSPEIRKQLHYIFRKKQAVETDENQSEALFRLSVLRITELLAKATHNAPVENLIEYGQTFDEKTIHYSLPQPNSSLEDARALVEKIIPEKQTIVCFIDGYDLPVPVLYNVPGVSEQFAGLEKIVKKDAQLGLTRIKIDENGAFVPLFIVLEPDFLYDVTSVSECFTAYGADPSFYLINKFQMRENKPEIMSGNIANFFLDELLNAPDIDEVEHKTVFQKSFRINPLAFALFDDDTVIGLYKKSAAHFHNIRQVIKNDFNEYKIKREDSFLEPSFISPHFGIQGRLDLLHLSAENDEKMDIIELKGGKAPDPVQWYLWRNHLIQVQLYDLLIESTFKNKRKKGFNFILYASASTIQLRHADRIEREQQAAIMLRNRLAAIDYELATLPPDELPKQTLRRLKSEYHLNDPSFVHKKFMEYEQVMRGADSSELAYFHAFLQMISAELLASKVGGETFDGDFGHSSLWQNRYERKVVLNEILAYLQLTDERDEESASILAFNRTEKTLQFTNFRAGDIAVLYPFPNETATASDHQVFKCNIICMDKDQIKVKLRIHINDTALFRQYPVWALEKDTMDFTTNQLLKNIYLFLGAPQLFRDLLLCRRPPSFDTAPIRPSENLSKKQNAVFQKALSANDYFLVQGPPGSGKTTMLLKEMVRRLFEETDENILLIAFTNRAVDEICEAIDDVLASDEVSAGYGARNSRFIRIGNQLSCSAPFQGHLLDNLAAKAKNRQEILDFIAQSRVFVANIATINSKTEIFRLKSFDTIIIDEASQLIEPHLLFVLSQARRFIMIGDEKQLPAVVTLSAEQTAVGNPELRAVGLTNLRNSLFERLLKMGQKNGWPSFDMLEEQGRMHEDIYQFPKKYFYNDRLQLALPDKQTISFEETDYFHRLTEWDNPVSRLLCEGRMLFIPSPPEPSDRAKINQHEARLVALMAQKIVAAYADRFDETTLGIITPFRAQIGLIYKELESLLPAFAVERIVVDTVERFQGGTRDIMLVSFAIGRDRQMKNLVALTEDGKVDRKLNVALTRAKMQLVLMGAEDILTVEQVYANLISEIKKAGGYKRFDWSQLETV